VESSNLYMTIRNRGKSIPYGSGNRPDGSTNHGYKRLKGNVDLAASIPEAQEMDYLHDALVRLNDPNTAFFSVGCEKSVDVSERGTAVAGYLELAFNFAELAADAQYYFKLFFQFSGLMAQSPNESAKVRYVFELEPAHFHDGPVDGFTVTVWIATTFLPTREQAIQEWGRALSALVSFLEGLSVKPDLTPIYAPGKQLADLH
jgi:hypothetical protein